MRTLSLAVVALAGTLLFAAAAGAGGKQRVVVERSSGPFEFTVPCADFGPYEFDNVVQGHERVQATEVLAKDGTLLQLVLHIQFQETDTNSETGGSLRLSGSVHEVWDFASNTRTVSGKVFLGTGRGGTWVQDTGRITMTLDTNEVRFLGGPHEAFFAGGIDVVACAALAAA